MQPLSMNMFDKSSGGAMMREIDMTALAMYKKRTLVMYALKTPD
jgi:hypothetical protein